MQPADPVAPDRPNTAADAAEVMNAIRSGEITTVIVGGCDLSGVFRAKRISAERFLGSDEPSVQFSEYTFVIDIADHVQPRPEGYEGWWPGFHTGMADIDAVCDLTTLRRVPWLERTALVLCDYRRLDGSVYEFAPRSLLRRVLARYEELGLAVRLAPEIEFTAFRETERSATEKGFRDLEPLFAKVSAFGEMQATLDQGLIGKVVDGLDGMRVPIEAWNPEGAPGQYELNLAHAPALEAADRGFLFKQGTKEICALEGVTASFMSKISEPIPGNSMHVHQSLWRDGEPAFHDPNAEDGMSNLMRHFVAGQLRTLIPFAVVWAPSPTAFKRPAPYMGMGTSENWGGDNRMTSIRVLADEKRCRVEHRLPGADANIYLVIAAMLAGGLYGIENELELPPRTEGDAFLQTDLKPMPTKFDLALGLFEESEVANEYLGEEFVRRYAASRHWEEQQIEKVITDWELERFFIRS